MHRNIFIKKLVSCILAFVVIFFSLSMAISAYSNNMQPMSNNISYASTQLQISGINSTSVASIATNGVMNITVKMELQKLKSGSYETIKTWTESKTATQLIVEKTRLINAIATYRLKVTFDAGSDHIVKYAYPT